MSEELFGRVSEGEFEILRQQYIAENLQYDKSLIFHVGTGAGLYSELGAMLECMCYCYVNKIQFNLYADDANFSNENGWKEFFEPFSCEKHNSLNRKYNYRYKKYHRIHGVAIPNFIFRRAIIPSILKKKENVTYLTQDLFDKIVSEKFRFSKVEWPLFNMSGVVRDEYAKLTPLALRYNKKTANDITKLIEQLHLPEHFVSIQIRGGDKTQEFTNIIDADYCSRLLEKRTKDMNNIFVFTDDYRNIKRLQELHPEWNIITLTRADECGYYNATFNALSWEERKKDLIKLFAIVEICIRSDIHIGCNGACVNNYIRSCRMGKPYDEYVIGEARSKKGFDKVKRILGV